MSAAQQTRDHRRFRLAGNDNETIVVGLRRVDPTDGDDELGPLGARRLRR